MAVECDLDLAMAQPPADNADGRILHEIYRPSDRRSRNGAGNAVDHLRDERRAGHVLVECVECGLFVFLANGKPHLQAVDLDVPGILRRTKPRPSNTNDGLSGYGYT